MLHFIQEIPKKIFKYTDRNDITFFSSIPLEVMLDRTSISMVELVSVSASGVQPGSSE